MSLRAAPGRPQASVEVGAPGDRFEQEADRVADQVMRMPAGDTSTVQRKCPECEEESEEKVQRSCAKCQEEEKPRRKTAPAASGASPGADSAETAAGISSLRRGGGRPLPVDTRAFFEPRFGQDFSGVRIHTGEKAEGLARSIQARAFTVGNDVAFAAGQFQPGTPDGRRLLAHELTHTVQQTGGSAPAVQRKVEGAGEPAETATPQVQVVTETETAQCPTPDHNWQPPEVFIDQQSPDPVKSFEQGAAQVDADVLAVHSAVLSAVHPNRDKPILAVVPEEVDEFHALLSGPGSSDVVTRQQADGRFAAWFDCAAAPRNATASLIRMPVSPRSEGGDKVWTGSAKGSGLREKGRSRRVWGRFPGAKDMADRIPPGDITLEIRDTKGAVFKTLEPHERLHAAAWEKAFKDVIVPWTDAVAGHSDEIDAVHGRNEKRAVKNLYKAVGGTKRDIAKKALKIKTREDSKVDRKKGVVFTIDRIQTHLDNGKTRVVIFIVPT